MGQVGPAETFSLLCRTVAVVTANNSVNGHNLPLLLLFKVVTGQRNLAFPHTAADTLALTTYMTTTFQYAKVEQVAELLAGAFHLSVAAVDISTRETVRLMTAPRYEVWGQRGRGGQRAEVRGCDAWEGISQTAVGHFMLIDRGMRAKADPYVGRFADRPQWSLAVPVPSPSVPVFERVSA